MAIVDVVCPHCGKEAKATTAPGSQFDGVTTDSPGSNLKSKYGAAENTCSTCGGTFWSYYVTE
ncbi:hypothetical protein [Halobellus limi]|uniref:Uncharacterized protein n=1 Tax=Halobellus limi TaxID=699433 RepID=A0A1H5SYW7_9EURY|nr:hypothetical protein [Halobellus limi]QCC47451.1 hypothetical protein DV707_07120 [Halobellus limi]SEF55709.1 hypothetical protein SAMN04488133_0120 [Halobellus limi]